MQIENDRVVTINYTLTDTGGTILDQSQDASFCYLHGAQNIIPGLEEALHGKQVEDSCKIVLDPSPRGFRKGAEFNASEVRETLFMGHFAPGTIIQMARKQYQVEGKYFHPQTLRRISNE